MDDDEQGDPHLEAADNDRVNQDLVDLQAFEEVFGDEGTRGVSMWCHDCDEEHYYPWQLLRESLELLLETGEIPVHEPAFDPDPDQYVPWEYARGYVDALRDVGADQRIDLDACGRCGFTLEDQLRVASFCPRCGTPLLRQRLVLSLRAAGLDGEALDQALRRAGLPGR